MPSSPPPAEPAPAAARPRAARPLRALLAMLAVAAGVLAGTYWYPWSYRSEFQLSFRPTSAVTTPAELARYAQEQCAMLKGLVASRSGDYATQLLEHVQVTMASPDVIRVRVDRRDRWTLLGPPLVDSRISACGQAKHKAQHVLMSYQSLRFDQARLAEAAAAPAMPASVRATAPASVAIAPAPASASAPAEAQAVPKQLAALQARRGELMRQRDELDAQIDGDDARRVQAARALADENPRVAQIVAAIDALQAKRDDATVEGSSREQVMGELADRYIELKAELVRTVAKLDRQAQALDGPMELPEAGASASQATPRAASQAVSQAASEPALAPPAASTALTATSIPAADLRPIRPQFELVISGGWTSHNWLHPYRPVLPLHVAAAGGAGLLAGLAFLCLGRRGKP